MRTDFREALLSVLTGVSLPADSAAPRENHPRKSYLLFTQIIVLKHRAVILALERTAVYAALVGRIFLVRSNLNTVERAVILVAAVELAVLDAAMDTMIDMIFAKHIHSPQ